VHRRVIEWCDPQRLIPEAASYLTDLWVGVAFSPQISVPAFILLFAIARTRLASRDGRGGGT